MRTSVFSSSSERGFEAGNFHPAADDPSGTAQCDESRAAIRTTETNIGRKWLGIPDVQLDIFEHLTRRRNHGKPAGGTRIEAFRDHCGDIQVALRIGGHRIRLTATREVTGKQITA